MDPADARDGMQWPPDCLPGTHFLASDVRAFANGLPPHEADLFYLFCRDFFRTRNISLERIQVEFGDLSPNDRAHYLGQLDHMTRVARHLHHKDVMRDTSGDVEIRWDALPWETRQGYYARALDFNAERDGPLETMSGLEAELD